MRKAQIFKMPSGAELHVQPSEFMNAGALMQAVLKQLAGLKLSAEDLQRDVEDIKNDPGRLSMVIDKAINLATSNEIRNAAFACMGTVKYSPRANAGLISVGPELFDDEEFGEQAKEDYFTILYRIAEVNCKPFFVKTFSALLAPKGQSLSAPTLQ